MTHRRLFVYEEVSVVYSDIGDCRRSLRGYLSPDKAAHSEALKDVLNTAITEELSSSDKSDAGLVMFGSMIGTGIGGLVIDNMLKVDNHFVCSIGTMTYDGETRVVSVGIMNHVFTPGEEALKKAVRELNN